ncbi:cell division protein FtsZ [Candidatus Woesearchaeota archaeon]|jgi:cell division protein FtsZ|nr:cell division protein FtsZ [Candidatus Woesearchaeota archaeon]MBT5396923.1 cell division protein FtsZ [Candidatus Woesearchaeota archaeon]MBT5924570.1 cell division protein FtsZ [Candidatus Woesearchaeota archaeon]MBT6367116.1 cell division protein FtsZ [Candidatus Woesearchaeota archaeon]MBT7762310.1 cell division protein FtsZ [Candidatus Woesearchaeota archaeon]
MNEERDSPPQQAFSQQNQQQPQGVPKAEQISHSQANADVDAELERLIASQTTRIKVIGCGGAGNNTINRISEVGIKGIETIAINTDAQDLLYTSSTKKLLIGKELTQGLGAGSNPRIGEEAAKENEHDLKKLMTGADMVFITCGLGGGTGSGSAPYIAQLAKKMGILSIAIVTVPFTMEGSHRFENAMTGLEKLEHHVNTLIVIPNEKLLELAPHLPLQTAFKVADEILTNSVKGIAELVTKTGLVNLDFADVKAIMSEGGVAMIGMGESDSENRAEESVEKALANPLIDVDISTASGALINISGGDSLTLDESRKIVERVGESLDNDAKIIWGAQIYKDLEKTIRTMIIVTGVHSEQIFGESNTYFERKKDSMGSELGIDFME